MEQLLGRKEVEIVLLQNVLDGSSQPRRKSRSRSSSAQTCGLNATLDAIGLPKSTCTGRVGRWTIEEKHAHLRQPVIEILRDNPYYGYRRILPDLKERGYPVGETVLRRVLQMWDLSLQRWRASQDRPFRKETTLPQPALGLAVQSS